MVPQWENLLFGLNKTSRIKIHSFESRNCLKRRRRSLSLPARVASFPRLKGKRSNAAGAETATLPPAAGVCKVWTGGGGVGGGRGRAQQVGGLKSIRWYVASRRCQPALLCHRRLSTPHRNAEGPRLKPDPHRHWVELAAVGGACCSAVFLGWECKSGDVGRGGE